MDKLYIIVAGLALVLFLIVSAVASVTSRQRRKEAMDRCRYRPKKHLMVGVEKTCFQLLNEIFGENFYILPQVSLDSLLSHKVGNQDRYEAYSFIEHKYVDFVFCNKRTLRPVCAVKIEDSTSDDQGPGSDPNDMKKFFRSAHLPFVYLEKPRNLTRERVIEEFSRVIYETSLIQPEKRGRKKKPEKETSRFWQKLSQSS